MQCQNKKIISNLSTFHWTWVILCFTFKEQLLFWNPFATCFFILSYSCPLLLFVHTNISTWEQGEICKWKVNNCRHVKKDWVWKAKKQINKQKQTKILQKFSLIWQYHVDSSQIVFSVPWIDTFWDKVIGWIRALAQNERFSTFQCSSSILSWYQTVGLELTGIWWTYMHARVKSVNEDAQRGKKAKPLRERIDGR